MKIQDYSDEELIQTMNLNDPSDRELEARIIFLMNKYKNSNNVEMARFFDKVYDRFFGNTSDTESEESEEENEETREAFETIEAQDTINDDGTVVRDESIQSYSDAPEKIKIVKNIEDEEPTNQTSQGQDITGTAQNIGVTKQVDIVDGKVNPLLLQTIKRVISIDSQYRNSQYRKDTSGLSTEFTFSLSDPLKDVVSLKLYSVGIPYTWYTVNNNFGSNFFLIQGNSPGINDALLNDVINYNIQIKSGNYRAQELVDTINSSLTTSLSNVSDMSFGSLTTQTYIEYNSNRARATINLFFEKLYNESSYVFEFPTWTTPNDPTLPGPRVESVPGFLGFNNTSYYFNQVHSLRNIDSATNFSAKQFTLNNTNNFFTVYKYIGPDPYNVSTSVIDATFNVGLGLVDGSYSHIELETALNNALTTHSKLTNSSIVRTYVDSSLQLGYTNYYYNLTINFDRDTTNNVLYSKPYIEFPDESAILREHRIWTDISSCFRYEDLSYDMVEFVSETETLEQQEENPVILNDLSFEINCVKPGFNLPANNYSVSIANSNENGYSLAQFSNAFNASLTEIRDNSITSNNPQGEIILENSLFILNPDATFSFQIDMDKRFIKTDYKTDLSINGYTDPNTGQTVIQDISSCFINKLNFQESSLNDHSQIITSTTVARDTGGINFFPNINSVTDVDFLINSFILSVKPTKPTNSGSSESPVYTVDLKDFLPLDFSYNNALPNETENMINARIDVSGVIFGQGGSGTDVFKNQTIEVIQKMPAFFNRIFEDFTDNDGQYVLSGTKLRAYENEQSNFYFTLDIDVNKTLNEDAYQCRFIDSSFGLINGDKSALKHLNFDPSFIYNPTSPSSNTNNITYDSSVNFIDMSQNTLQNQSIVRSTFLSTESVKIKKIIINDANNRFNIKPYQHIKSPGNENDMIFYIANGYYNRDQLITAINNALTYANTSVGNVEHSSISLINKTINGTPKQFAKFRINVRKDYSAKDLKIIFYDKEAFVSCYAGVSSVRNTTSDATLGWLLGFRKKTIYELNNNDSSIVNYDSTSLENVISMEGDTTVTTDLYNKLFIVIDDYNQNRLNDGLVTNVDDSNSTPLPSYATRRAIVCDPLTNSPVYDLNATDPNTFNRLTTKKMYSANAIQTQRTTETLQSGAGPYAKDIFAVIPIKVSSLQNGDTYTEFGGTLQSQERVYFGPVNINRMTVKLISDRGDVVDLNGSDWTFSLIAEQLYQSSTK